MRIAILLLVFLIVGVHSNGQVFEWAGRIGGLEYDRSTGIATDEDGNTYTVGSFKDTADFDPGVNEYNLISEGNTYSFIVKLDTYGEFVWAKKLGGTQTTSCSAIALDDQGNIYTTGYFRETADFDPGPNIYNMEAFGPWEIFVSKLDNDGNFVWAKQFSGATGGRGQSIKTDTQGNVFVGGYFADTVDFDPGPAQFSVTSNGSNDAFVCKLDEDGHLEWVNTWGGNEADYLRDIDLDSSGNCYVASIFEDTVDVDPSTDTLLMVNEEGGDALFSKFDADGNLLWSKQLGSPYSSTTTLTVDPQGDIFFAGQFSGVLDFDPGIGTNFMESSQGYRYILKLNTDGNYQWAQQTYAGLHSLTTDHEGNLYAMGDFSGTIYFERENETYPVLASNNRDFLIFKLTTDGQALWARGFGKANSFNEHSISLDPWGNIYTTGTFSNGTYDFDPGSDTFNLTTASTTSDVFIHKMSACSTPSLHINPVVCGSYTSPSGNHVWTTTGNYVDVFPDFNGCDSVVTIDLTVNHVDVSVQFGVNSIMSNATNANYQWLDCTNGVSVIPNANDQSYSPPFDGSYAVEVTQSGCVDTSNCYGITVPGIESLALGALILYPNPTTSAIRIQLPENNLRATRTSLYDISGRLVRQQPFNPNMDLGYLDRGTYIVVVETVEGNFRGTVIKE